MLIQLRESAQIDGMHTMGRGIKSHYSDTDTLASTSPCHLETNYPSIQVKRQGGLTVKHFGRDRCMRFCMHGSPGYLQGKDPLKCGRLVSDPFPKKERLFWHEAGIGYGNCQWVRGSLILIAVDVQCSRRFRERIFDVVETFGRDGKYASERATM